MPETPPLTPPTPPTEPAKPSMPPLPPTTPQTPKPLPKVESKVAAAPAVWMKNKKVWLAFGAVVILAVATGAAFALKNGDPVETTTPAPTTPTPSPVPTTQASQLDGTIVAGELALRHPLAIMVENTPDARPQSGLATASIVYEAIVEGGITRFMAVYGPALPERVGPVRSARLVFVDLSKEYPPQSAYYAHVGGAADALAALRQDKLYDLDQSSIGDKAFQRFPKAGVATEHTMYSFPSKLYTVAKDKGFKGESTMRPWLFKTDAEAANRPETQVITIPFSGGSYDATYTYDKPSNTYKRSVQGKEFKDALTNAALSPKNLVVQYTTYSTRKNDDKGRQDVNVSGSGNAKVMRDGLVIDAKWAKDKASNRTIFTDAATGKEIQLNTGQTFVHIVKTDAQVKVQ